MEKQKDQVTVQDMLFCRERRADSQSMLLEKYRCPVVSFCMNIPGPVKTSEQIRRAFEQGKQALLKAFGKSEQNPCGSDFSDLSGESFKILDSMEFHDKTGDELLLSVSGPAEKIKKVTTRIEENHPCGRLFDMDVIDTDGRKLSRPVYRKCLVCGRQAQECARSRRHTLEELETKVQEILAAAGL